MSRSISKWLSGLVALTLMLGMLPMMGAGQSYAQGGSRTFPETGKTVKGRFLEYWNANGGIPQQGYPISDEMQEKNDTDGKTYTVQYFERAIFEMHPENKAPYDVLLSLAGVFSFKKYHPNGVPDQKPSTDNPLKFDAKFTTHVIGGKFRAYWEKNGGLAQQGYPLTDEFQERNLANGKTYTVQYFERAVFELHPENQAPFDVLLSLLGRFEHNRKHSPAGAPITVGLLTDVSGLLAIYGPMIERGFALGLEYATDGTNKVMGHEIKVVVKDTGSDVAKGTSAARELIEKEGAKLLVGAPNSAVALAVSSLAAQNKIPFIAVAAGSPDLTGAAFNPYTFRAGRTSVQDALTLGAAALGMGKKFVQLAPDSAFGHGSANAFYGIIKGGGGTFPINDTAEGAGAVFVPQDATDFTPYVNQLLDSKAEVAVVTWSGAGFTQLFKAMTQLGVFDQMAVATGFGDNQTLKAGYQDVVGSSGLGIYHYTMWDNPVNNWLVQHHKAKYNSPPDLFTGEGFLAAQMIVKALEATSGDAGADKIIAALEGMKLDGPKNFYTIRASDHVLLQEMLLMKLKNVTDPDYKFFELVKRFTPEQTAPPCAVPASLNRCSK
jgi:branched-chain amino acid transport system substrate-binding protein